MGEEVPKENGPSSAGDKEATKDISDQSQQQDSQTDGAGGSRLVRRKSIRDQITGIGDLVLLDPLTEDALIANLRQRYGTDEIYVSNCRDTSTILDMHFSTSLNIRPHV